MAANCGDVFGGGTVSYDPGTHTLTLTNYTYSGEGAICDDSMYACIAYKLYTRGSHGPRSRWDR